MPEHARHHGGMRRTTIAGLVVAGAFTALLTGCDPGGDPAPSGSPSATSTSPGTATPDPSDTPAAAVAPARADLALSPDGMGTLVFGEAPASDPATQMLVLEPEWCTEASTGSGAGVMPGDPEAPLWVPIPAYRDGRDSDFGAHVEAGVLDRIDLFDEAIPTTEGVRIGDARSAVEAAYPGAAVVSNDLTDIYVVTGARGSLQLEVTTDDPYWAGFRPADVVVYVHAVQTGVGPFSVAASENIAGICHL
jgi:hypothetical protein